MEGSPVSSSESRKAMAAVKIALRRLARRMPTSDSLRFFLGEMEQVFFEDEHKDLIRVDSKRRQGSMKSDDAVDIWKEFVSVGKSGWLSSTEESEGYSLKTSVFSTETTDVVDMGDWLSTNGGGPRGSLEACSLDPATAGLRVRVTVCGPSLEVATELFARVIVAECLAASRREEIGTVIGVETAQSSASSDITHSILDAARATMSLADDKSRIAVASAAGMAKLVTTATPSVRRWKASGLDERADAFTHAVKRATLDRHPIRVRAVLKTAGLKDGALQRVECLYLFYYYKEIGSPVPEMRPKAIYSSPKNNHASATAQNDDENIRLLSALATQDFTRLTEIQPLVNAALVPIMELRLEGERLVELVGQFSAQSGGDDDDLVRRPEGWWGGVGSVSESKIDLDSLKLECLRDSLQKWRNKLLEWFSSSTNLFDADKPATIYVLRNLLLDNSVVASKLRADANNRAGELLRHFVLERKTTLWLPNSSTSASINCQCTDEDGFNDNCCRVVVGGSEETFESERLLIRGAVTASKQTRRDLLIAIEEAARGEFLDKQLRLDHDMVLLSPHRLRRIIAVLSAFEKGTTSRILRSILPVWPRLREIANGANERSAKDLERASAGALRELELERTDRQEDAIAESKPPGQGVVMSPIAARGFGEAVRESENPEHFARSRRVLEDVANENSGRIAHRQAGSGEETCRSKLLELAKSGVASVATRLVWDAAAKSSTHAWKPKLLVQLSLEACKASESFETDAAIAAKALLLPTLAPLDANCDRGDDSATESWVQQQHTIAVADDEAKALLAIACATVARARRIADHLALLAARAKNYTTSGKCREGIIVLRRLLHDYKEADSVAASAAVDSAKAGLALCETQAMETSRTKAVRSAAIGISVVWSRRLQGQEFLHGSFVALNVANRSAEALSAWLGKLDAIFDRDAMRCKRYLAIRGLTPIVLAHQQESSETSPLIEAQLDVIVECRRPADVSAAPKLAVSAIVAALLQISHDSDDVVFVCAAVGDGREQWGGGRSRLDLQSFADSAALAAENQIAIHLLLRPPDSDNLLLAPVIVRCVLWTFGLSQQEPENKEAMLRENVYASVQGARNLISTVSSQGSPISDLRQAIASAVDAGEWRRAYLLDHRLALLDASFPALESLSEEKRARLDFFEGARLAPLDVRLAAHDRVLSLTETCRNLEVAVLVMIALVSRADYPHYHLSRRASLLTDAILAFFAEPRCIHFRAASLFAASKLLGARLDPVSPPKKQNGTSLVELCVATELAAAAELRNAGIAHLAVRRLKAHATEILREVSDLLSAISSTLAQTAHLASDPRMRAHFLYVS